MRLRFTKMHGLGNDFVVIDGVTQRVRLSADKVRRIADRHFGVGCDQLLLVELPQNPDVDFRYRIFNCDGSEVENCGNGARCFARFVVEQKLTGKRVIRVETNTGIMELRLGKNDDVSVDMGIPITAPANIPFLAGTEAVTYPIEIEGQSYTIGAVSMGNPHAVMLLNDINDGSVERLGPPIEQHPLFPQRVNAGFIQVLSPSEAKLRVYERGVGETLACGTGACAAMVAARLQNLLDSKATLHLPGGSLSIEWQGPGHTVIMTGPATTVFQGQLKI